MTLNIGIISSANIALLGTSQGHMLPDYTYLKNFFISSRQYLANAIMKNNHHFDFGQAFVSTAGVNAAFLH